MLGILFDKMVATFIITFYAILSGILRDKTMEDKLIYIPNDDKHNYPFCWLKLLVEKFDSNQYKILKCYPRLCGLKTLGTSVIYNPMIPSLPKYYALL